MGFSLVKAGLSEGEHGAEGRTPRAAASPLGGHWGPARLRPLVGAESERLGMASMAPGTGPLLGEPTRRGGVGAGDEERGVPRPGGDGLWTAMGNRRYRPQALVTRALPDLLLESTVMWARIGGLPGKVRRACERPRGWGRVRPRAVSGGVGDADGTGGPRQPVREQEGRQTRRAEGCGDDVARESLTGSTRVELRRMWGRRAGSRAWSSE